MVLTTWLFESFFITYLNEMTCDSMAYKWCVSYKQRYQRRKIYETNSIKKRKALQGSKLIFYMRVVTLKIRITNQSKQSKYLN